MGPPTPLHMALAPDSSTQNSVSRQRFSLNLGEREGESQAWVVGNRGVGG